MPKFILCVILAISAASAVASLVTFNLYLILFSVCSSLCLFFLYKLWDVFEALLIKKTGVVQVLGDYELEAERFSAVRKIGPNFSAVSAAILRSFPSKEITRDSIERIIASSNSPFKFVVQVERLDTSKITDDLKTKRRMKELELSKTRTKKSGDSDKVVERELELIESEIRSITSGEVPLKTSIYLISFGSSESRFAAQERALSQIKELSGEFSAVLGAGFEVLNGSELISVIKSDMFC